jgi:hypothetical protein
VLGLLVDIGEGGDYLGQHLIGGLRALGWTANCALIMLGGFSGDESMADAARALVAQSPAVIVALGDSVIRTAQARSPLSPSSVLWATGAGSSRAWRGQAGTRWQQARPGGRMRKSQTHC